MSYFDRANGNNEVFFSELKRKSSWFLILGGLLIVTGIVSLYYIYTATLISVYFIAITLTISGVLQLIYAFQTTGIGKTIFWLLIALLYIVAGGIIFIHPIEGIMIVTLTLASALIVIGVFRVINGIQIYRMMNSWWVIASGIITFILGICILASWPLDSLYILGLFLGIDFIFSGWSYIAFYLALKKS